MHENDIKTANERQDEPAIDRRSLVKLTGASVAASARAQTMTTEWDKVFPKSDKVDHKKITLRRSWPACVETVSTQKPRSSLRVGVTATSKAS